LHRQLEGWSRIVDLVLRAHRLPMEWRTSRNESADACIRINRCIEEMDTYGFILRS